MSQVNNNNKKLQIQSKQEDLQSIFFHHRSRGDFLEGYYLIRLKSDQETYELIHVNREKILKNIINEYEHLNTINNSKKIKFLLFVTMVLMILNIILRIP